MNKQIIIVNGSPRKNGNSALLAEQVLSGAKSAGADVERFDLHEMHIQPCTACDSCQQENEQNCIIQDDMQMLYPKLRRTDALVIVSPIYWFTVNAQTKLFIDRGFYPLSGPHGNAMQGKQLGIVLAYADTDPFTSGAVNALHTFQDISRLIGTNIAGMVYGSAWKAGDIQRQPEVMEKAYQLGQQLGMEE